MMNTYNNGTAALQFPSHYVPLTEEEMTYVDGGGITNKKLISTTYVSASICSDIAAVLGGGATATARKLSQIAGLWGYVIDALIGLSTAYFAIAAGRGGLKIKRYEGTYYSQKEGYSWKVNDIYNVSYRN